MRLTIRGQELPGRALGGHSDVHVALQVRHELVNPVPGDAEDAEWTVELSVLAGTDGFDFRGPAVQGRRGERFIYLSWVDRAGSDFHMFRRVKLMLNDLDSSLASADSVIATVRLTDKCGMPLCARVTSDAIRWEAG